MGVATIDPYSHRVQTKLYKIAKFGVNRPNSKQHAAIKKTYKEMCMAIRMLSEHSVRVAIHISLYTNFDILKLLYPAYILGLFTTKLGDFCESRCALSDYVDQHACKTSAHAQGLYFQNLGCECELHNKNAFF